MAKVPLRIVGIGRDIELRVVSFLTRARQATEHVAFIDLGSEDETAILVEEVGCSLLTSESSDIVSIARCLIESDLEPAENYLFIHINKEWSLREFPLHLNRSRENWDVYIGLVSNIDEEESRPTQSDLSAANFQHASVSFTGLEELASAERGSTAHDLSDQLRVRVIESTTLPSLPQRESLATASRFAQLFIWMIESRHPLFLFGIPGIVLFVLGYRLSGGVVNTFTELSTESIGVTLLTIAMTLFGLFAMMIAVILYIMGKQVEQVQAQYDGPRGGR